MICRPKTVAAALLIGLSCALPATAKPPLSEVQPVNDGLLEVALADDIRKRCDGISARLLRGLGRLRALHRQAQALGYSRDEIDAFIGSDTEKARMRSRAAAYYRAAGANPGRVDEVCALGRREITGNTGIGALLRLN